jgi:hypothetical protein
VLAYAGEVVVEVDPGVLPVERGGGGVVAVLEGQDPFGEVVRIGEITGGDGCAEGSRRGSRSRSAMRRARAGAPGRNHVDAVPGQLLVMSSTGSSVTKSCTQPRHLAAPSASIGPAEPAGTPRLDATTRLAARTD